MLVKCPFCGIERIHDEDAILENPNTVYTCLTNDCKLIYTIVLHPLCCFIRAINATGDITIYQASTGTTEFDI